jgi:hypothetical protein
MGDFSKRFSYGEARHSGEHISVTGKQKGYRKLSHQKSAKPVPIVQIIAVGAVVFALLGGMTMFRSIRR